MKKLMCVIFALVICLTVCACESDENKGMAITSTSVEKANEGKEIANNAQAGENVTITVSPVAFNDMDSEDIGALIEEHNFNSFEENDDGSVTITMSRDAKEDAIIYFKDMVDHAVEVVMEGEGEVFESVISVEYNSDYTVIDYVVDKDTFSSLLCAFSAAFRNNIAWYQALTGAIPESVSLVIRYTYEGEQTPFREDIMVFSERSPKEDSSVAEIVDSEQTHTTAQTINDGDRINIEDYCEFTVVGWDNVDKITRNNMVMLTGNSNENNTIIRLTLDYTNLSTTEQKVRNDSTHARDEDILKSSTLIYDGKYTYTGGCGCWSDLLPLTQDELYVFFNVPKSIIESNGAIVIEFQISDKLFTYTVR